MEVVKTQVTVTIAIVTVFAAAAVEGRDGIRIPVLLGVLLVVPGDLVRRAVAPGRSARTVETIAVTFVLSCVVLTVVAALLAVPGVLGQGSLILTLVLVGGALVAVAARRGDRAIGAPITMRAVATIVTLAAVSLCLFHVEPRIGDRIFLGQLRTSVELSRATHVPARTWTFGEFTSFPVNYLFWDLIVSALSLTGGVTHWGQLKVLAAGLRLTQLGLFAIAWYLVAREVLHRFPAGVVTRLCSISLPLLLLFNPVMAAKFREPIVEGFGIAMLGVSTWALLRAGRRMRPPGGRYVALSAAGMALLAGIHFPAFVEGVVLLGAWLLVTALSRAVTSSPDDPGGSVRAGLKLLVRPVGLYLGAAVGALIVLRVVGSNTPVGLAARDVTERTVFRAYTLYIGDPLTGRSLADFVSARWSRDFFFVGDQFVVTTLVLGAIALVGLVVLARRESWVRRIVTWCVVAELVTFVYVGIGFWFGRTTVSPWNAVTRNGFYLWLPVALLLMLGLRAVAGFLAAGADTGRSARRNRTVLAVAATVALLIAVVYPLDALFRPLVQDNGWIGTPQMTADGEEALRWVDRNTPRGAVVLMGETTFGSSLLTNRKMVTEGFATLESAEVTRAAVNALGPATEFLLPAHSPKALLDGKVDYVVVPTNQFVPGQLGGIPLIGAYVGLLAPVADRLDLGQLPYLEKVKQFPNVTVYRVDRSRIPPLHVLQIGPTDPVPPCTDGTCQVERHIQDGTCPPEQLSSRRDVCIVMVPSST